MPINIPVELTDLLRRQPVTAVLTGAGTSAESGVPTFREAQTGLWAQYDPMELATPQAFARQPTLVWEWYQWRRELVQKAQPNPGHRALSRLSQLLPDLTLITQNVDGLHQRAGSQGVIELHGNILRTICSQERIPVNQWEDREEKPPRCPNCGSYLRPDVVWFGEGLPEEALDAAWRAAQDCELFFSIGTSSVVEPAASLPFIALQSGAVVVEINPNPTSLSASARHVLRGPSGIVLPALVAKLQEG